MTDILTIPDIINEISSYYIRSLYDLIIFANINDYIYDWTDNNFDKIYQTIKSDPELQRLTFEITNNDILFLGKIFEFFKKKTLTIGEINILMMLLKNKTINNYPVLNYLLHAKHYAVIAADHTIPDPMLRSISEQASKRKSKNIENKIGQKIFKYWSTFSEKYCLSLDKSQINIVGPHRQLVLNTCFVVACHKYYEIITNSCIYITNYERYKYLTNNINKLLKDGADPNAGFYICNVSNCLVTKSKCDYFECLCMIIRLETYCSPYDVVIINKIKRSIFDFRKKYTNDFLIEFVRNTSIMINIVTRIDKLTTILKKYRLDDILSMANSKFMVDTEKLFVEPSVVMKIIIQ